jgi:malate permease and related proteins
MFDLAFLLAPTFATFFLGMVLRRSSVLNDRDADVLFKLVYHLTLPALLLSVLPYIPLKRELFLIPFISALIILITYAVAALTGKIIPMRQQTYAVLVTGSIIMNLGFVMPFVQSFYGDDGLGRLFMFDVPNGLSAYTLAYAFACRHGRSGKQHRPGGKLFKSPPLLALIAGILMNALSLQPEPLSVKILHTVGSLTIPLILLGLGASFSLAKINPLHLAAGIALRMMLGLGLGLWLAGMFHLEGVDRAIVILAASAPAGFNTLTFASMEQLDREFAATLVASCMIVSMLLIPVLLTIL